MELRSSLEKGSMEIALENKPAEQAARTAWEAWKQRVRTGGPECVVSAITDDCSFVYLNPIECFRGILHGKDEYRATSLWRLLRVA